MSILFGSALSAIMQGYANFSRHVFFLDIPRLLSYKWSDSGSDSDFNSLRVQVCQASIGKQAYSLLRKNMAGPEKRRKREKEQRKKAILKAARKLFAEFGYRPVTVASIAKKAELSKGAIYLYFNSKEEIYAQILIGDIETFHKAISQIFQKGEPASQILYDFADAYIDIFLHAREQFRTLMNFMLNADNLNLSNGIRKQIIREMNRTISLIEKILQYGVDSGELVMEKDHMRNMRNALWGFLNGVISLHLFVGVESMREERIRSNVRKGLETIIDGLSTTNEEEQEA